MDETTMMMLTGLLGTALVTVLFGAALAGAWLLGREQGRRRAAAEARESLEDGGAPLATAAELSGVTRALETLAREVERVSEAQRFTERLLAEGRASEIRPLERIVAPVVRPPGRVDTPH